MASGTALGRAGREAAAADPDGILAALAGGPDKVTGQVVFDAAQHGDQTARELFGQIGYWLGVGIASVVNLLDIELVVIGGGLVNAGDLLLGPARESFGRFLFGRTRRPLPPIVPARFGPDAGVVGAAALALDQGNLRNPASIAPPGYGQDVAVAADQYELLTVREDLSLTFKLSSHSGSPSAAQPGAQASGKECSMVGATKEREVEPGADEEAERDEKPQPFMSHADQVARPGPAARTGTCC